MSKFVELELWRLRAALHAAVDALCDVLEAPSKSDPPRQDPKKK